MSRLKSSQRKVEVFSARRFFSECAARAARPSGLHEVQLNVPVSGLHLAHQSSLEWVDGFFAHSEECERLISSIERRDLPRPLISHTSHTLDTRCIYTAVELLANSSESIIAAFGVVDQLVKTALASPLVDCPRCTGVASRLSSPFALGDLLLRDFAGREVTILASSADERFNSWAVSMGFSLQRDSTREQPYVRVDSGACSEDFIARLGGVLRSVWTIPQIFFSCHSSSGTRYYAPQGWCSTCAEVLTEPNRAALAKFLTLGHSPAALSDEKLPLERSLRLDAKLRIEDVATLSSRDLATPQNETLHELARLLLAFGLDEYSLAAPCNTLSAEHVALLSIAVSLYKARDIPSIIVVDLPSGILSSAQTRVRSIFSSPQHSLHSTIVLGDPFGALANSPSTANDAAAASLRRQPVEVKSCSSSQTGETNEEVSHVTEVPLFPSRASAGRILADELGIIQGMTQLYAASTDARCVGLTGKDFAFGSTRSHRYLCKVCKGLGVTLVEHAQLPRPLAKPCLACLGARFKEPVASTLFRATSYATFLNRPLHETLDTLRSLPRSKELPQYITLLDLQHLPLGMPIALLSSSELRRVLILKAVLAGRAGKVTTIAVEAPNLGFTKAQRDGLKALRELPTLAERCHWL